MGRAALSASAWVAGILGCALACGEAPGPQSGMPPPGTEFTQPDFPTPFPPGPWDADPRLGNAVDGTAFGADDGAREAILRGFVASSAELARFVEVELAATETQVFEIAGGIARLTQAGPGRALTQTLRREGGEVLHAAVMVLTGEVVFSYVHNLTTGAFDGTYLSPVEPGTRHRTLLVPLADGNRIFGAAHQHAGGAASTTHIGLLDAQGGPLRLLAFLQVERTFDQSTRDLQNRVARVVTDHGGAGGAAGANGAGGASIDRTESGPDESGERPAFPPLIEARFFELALDTVRAPADAATLFEPANILGRNAVRELATFYENARATVETDERGRAVEVRAGVVAGARFESRQSFEGGLQEAVAFVNRRKRLALIRDHRSGAFLGIVLAPNGDRNAPLCAIVSPNPDQTANHLLLADLPGAAMDDYRAELVVDAMTGQAIDFADLRPFRGGLAAEPACADLVRRFDFGGLVPGF